MKKTLIILVAGAFVFGLFSLAQAGKDNRGNGFPEGDHYNLNLIAKKSIPEEPGFFTCPDAETYQWDYYEEDGVTKCETIPDCPVIVPSSQNVIFVPRTQTQNDIEILIHSGSAKPGKKNKISDTYPELTVTDWCTADFDGNGAEFQLPENANGYDVYARVTGKPLEGTAWTFMTPVIQLTQDEYGNGLYYFGVIGGAEGCTDANGNILLDRIDTSKGNGKGKGVKQATDLSCLFDFTGDVCYVNDLCFYCPEDSCRSPLDGTDPVIDWPNEWDFVCCNHELDNQENTIEDTCGESANFNCGEPNEVCVAWDIDLNCTAWEWQCTTEGTHATDLMCYNYPVDTWVFDIADFVDVLWKSDTNGAYVVQLRFYKR